MCLCCTAEPIYGSVPGDLDKKGLEGIPLLDSAEDKCECERVAEILVRLGEF